MKAKSVVHFVSVFLVAVTITVNAQPKSPIPVMLLSGEQTIYHAWKTTNPAIEEILNVPEVFKVDVVLTPENGDLSTFMPKFSDYKVIVMNYDAPKDRWPDALKKSFEEYMTNGGGLVVIHAADNAFAGWPEFNKMIGIGGWRNRNQADGPYWYYKDGKLVSDNSPGSAGSHGQRTPFLMKVANADHPVTKGLPSSWMHQGDELYAKLRGPGENMNVLVTAYADPANRGTGFDELQIIAIPYGKGRVFHYTPGHDVVALSSTDCVVLLQRGTEWAATGKVTQKVPADFPTANSVSYRINVAMKDPNYKNGLNGLTPSTPRTGGPGGPRGGNSPGGPPAVPPPSTTPVVPPVEVK